MRIKLGLVGTGRQGQRYLDPKNWPDGVEVERFTRCPNCHGVIVATPANVHDEFTLFALEKLHLPVLVEKPTHAYPAVASGMMAASSREKVPLVTAFPHNFARGFAACLARIESLVTKAKVAAITGDYDAIMEIEPLVQIRWSGPHRKDGSCPGAMDWGSHAFAMAALICNKLPPVAPKPEVVVDAGLDRTTVVSVNGETLYDGTPEERPTPMRTMLSAFCRNSVARREMPDRWIDCWVNDQLEKLCAS